MNTTNIDNLRAIACSSIDEMGQAAANFVTENLRQTIREQGSARIILATGASQFSFLQSLRQETDLDWSKITVFHLDEYLGMTEQHPASFRKYLKERILDAVRPGVIHFLNGDVEDVDQELQKYSRLLLESPVDVACIGIGENGHIAFNDPPVADFNDPLWVKVVTLDQACRNQQLGEGWFKSLEDVPTQALSLTIPAIMRSKIISCAVPDQRKVAAVSAALYGPVSEACPASILRTHPNAVLWLDDETSSVLRS